MNLITLLGIKFLKRFNKMLRLIFLLLFSSAVLLLKTSFQFTNDVAYCIHTVSVFLSFQTSLQQGGGKACRD